MISNCICGINSNFLGITHSWKSQGCAYILQFFRVNMRFKSRYSHAGVKDLPWIQSKKDIYKKDPVFHRAIAVFMFQRLLKHVGAPPLHFKDFASGVKEAVKAIADCIKDFDAKDELKLFIGPALLRQYKISFDLLKYEGRTIELDINSIKGFHIAGARYIFGYAEPGDEYVLSLFGQKIILSKRDIEELEEEEDIGPFSGFSYGKHFAEEALRKKVRFQIDVKFKCDARYILWAKDDIDYHSESLCRSPVDSFHQWKFETVIPPPTEEFALDWYVVDVDDYLKNKYNNPEDGKNG